MLKAWRGLVGDELASIVVDQVLDEFADEKMQQHVNRYFGDYVKSTGLRFEMLANDGVEKCVEPIVELTVEGIIDEFCEYETLPAWMDQNWFLQKCSSRTICCWCGPVFYPRICSRNPKGTTSGRRTRRLFK